MNDLEKAPLSYYVVTEETMKQIAQDIKHSASQDEKAREKQILGLKVGTSGCMALTEDGARELFEKQVTAHNASY